MANTVIRSPRQATTVYGLDGGSAPRQKNLFYVRFVPSATLPATNTGWQNNLGFMVKSVDRPSIQPQVEELNQYNKKRQITVGYKIQPLRMSLYDTADSMVMSMWNDYSKWYYGDFNQTSDSFQYDVTLGSMNDSGSGFGYQPRPSSNNNDKDDPNDLNSQFFFNQIEIYQVFGGQYVEFDLINPKIATFDPDELAYDSSEIATINMTLAYEGILYKNNGLPQPINQNSLLSFVFGQTFDGDSLIVSGATARPNYQTSIPNVTIPPVSNSNFASLSSAVGLSVNSGNTLASGALAQFGNYDFGSLSRAVSLGGGIASDIASLASGNNPLSSLLNLPVGTPPVTNPESQLLGQTGSAPSPSVSSSDLDSALGELFSSGDTTNNPYAQSYISDNLAPGTAASAMMSGDSPTDQTVDGSGLALNSQTYGVVNAQRPSYSQIGFNSSTSDDYQPNGTQAVPVPGSSQPVEPQAQNQTQTSPVDQEIVTALTQQAQASDSQSAQYYGQLTALQSDAGKSSYFDNNPGATQDDYNIEVTSLQTQYDAQNQTTNTITQLLVRANTQSVKTTS
jgi:hypothetical protein